MADPSSANATGTAPGLLPPAAGTDPDPGSDNTPADIDDEWLALPRALADQDRRALLRDIVLRALI